MPPSAAVSSTIVVAAPASARVFRTALFFLGVAAALGALLRWNLVSPLPGFAYAHWLHAHSHVAFLGFVFNAFFAISLATFVPSEERRSYARLFVVMQIAVVGMLATFPWQGYGPASIAFSALHMAASAVFAWRLWRRNTAAPAARGHLRAALFFLVLSGLGPLALGPVAAAGLRDTPAYSLAIYFYLHAQYNGWFPFFLIALALQGASAPANDPARDRRSAAALRWLLAGALLTFAQSTLWLDPPPWVRGIAALGGFAQLAGFAYLLRALRPRSCALAGPARALAGLALAAFGAKLLLQLASALPGLAPLANHRFVVIAFLHLVFLGLVAPAIFAAALHCGWLRDRLVTRLALGLFFSAAALSEFVLVAVALGWAPPFSFPWALFAAAASMALAAVALFFTGGAANAPRA